MNFHDEILVDIFDEITVGWLNTNEKISKCVICKQFIKSQF